MCHTCAAAGMEDGHAGMACAPWLPHPARQPDRRTGNDRHGAAGRLRAFLAHGRPRSGRNPSRTRRAQPKPDRAHRRKCSAAGDGEAQRHGARAYGDQLYARAQRGGRPSATAAGAILATGRDCVRQRGRRPEQAWGKARSTRHALQRGDHAQGQGPLGGMRLRGRQLRAPRERDGHLRRDAQGGPTSSGAPWTHRKPRRYS